MAKQAKPRPKAGRLKPARGGRLAKPVRTTLLALAAGYGALCAFGWFATDAMIFPAPRPSYGVTEPGLTMIAIPGGGRVASLWLPRRDAARAILYLHGNGDDLGRIRPRLEFIRELTGCSILAIDYPGYGLSPGNASEAATLHAAEAAFAHLCEVRGYEADAVAVWGYSLGSGPAVHLAAHRRVGGLILDAPFTSTFRTVLPKNPLPFDRFDNLAIIDRVQCPLFIAHGDRDGVVPFAHGERLYREATGAPYRKFLRLTGVGHIGIPGEHGPAYRAEILAIVDRLRAPGR